MENSKKQTEQSKDEQIAALEQRLVVAEVAIQSLAVSLGILEAVVAEKADHASLESLCCSVDELAAANSHKK